MDFCLKNMTNNAGAMPPVTFTVTYNTTAAAAQPIPMYAWQNVNAAAPTVKCLCSKCRGGEPTPGAGA